MKEKIACIAGTPVDTEMGVELLKQNGYEAYAFPSSKTPTEETFFQMSTYEVKCSLVDVLIAERFIDEYSTPDLENTSQKYLKYGKTKERVETWVRENKAKRGDFRKYLKDAPWELTDEYVSGDAKNPVKIWRKQLTILKEQDLCKRVKLEFDCILPALQMTMYGLPIDEETKAKNYAFHMYRRTNISINFSVTYKNHTS